MEFEKVISERRSVRRYKAGTSIDKKTVEAVIAAAQQKKRKISLIHFF